MRRLKVDFHLHTSEDPRDSIPHSAEAAVVRAAKLGFDAISITCHERFSAGDARARAAAARLGVTLIPGIEALLEGHAHVIVLGGDESVEGLRTLDDLRRWKRPGHLVIAPHPYYPGRTALGPLLEKNIDVFDAIEWSHFYSRRFTRWNRQAAAAAERARIPLVGSSDVHRLDQLGLTYTLVEAESASPRAILDGVRAGRVELVTRPLSELRLAWIVGRLWLRNFVVRHASPAWRRDARPLPGDRVPEPHLPQSRALRLPPAQAAGRAG